MASPVKDALNAISLNRIPAQIELYEQLIQAAEPLFELEGKKLGEVIAHHAQELMLYDVMLQECKTIEDTVRVKLEEIESTLYRRLNETNQRALGTRDLQQYIKSEPQYVSAYEILLEVVHVKRKLEAIVEALKSLGWSLNNITKLRIAQLEHVTL